MSLAYGSPAREGQHAKNTSIAHPRLICPLPRIFFQPVDSGPKSHKKSEQAMAHRPDLFACSLLLFAVFRLLHCAVYCIDTFKGLFLSRPSG